MPVDDIRVMDIGCGEGGVLAPFWERGCTCVGVDMSEHKINAGRTLLADALQGDRLMLMTDDIYDVDVEAIFPEKFDLIILKDTIEHVYNQEKLLRRLKDYLVPGGRVFVGFPPWRMPFGGHQQTSQHKLAQLPYYHILPRPLYRGLLKVFGEEPKQIKALMEIVDTRLSISKFESIVASAGFDVEKRDLYLLNPIYEFKFGWKSRKQLPIIRSIPFFRDFVTTACYYVVQAKPS